MWGPKGEKPKTSPLVNEFCVVKVLSHPLAVLKNRSRFVIFSGNLQRDTGSARPPPLSPSLPSSLAWPGQGEPAGLLGLFLNNEDLSVPLIYLCMEVGREFSPGSGKHASRASRFLGAKTQRQPKTPGDCRPLPTPGQTERAASPACC